MTRCPICVYTPFGGRVQGNLTALNMMTYIAPLAQTGGLHAVSMDFAAQVLYVANAAYPLTNTSLASPQAAYNRQMVKLDMGPLFAEQQ